MICVLDFCANIATAKNLEFLDTPRPVHIHIQLVNMHEYKSIMMILIASVQQISFTHVSHVSFVQNVAHVRFCSNRAHEFINQKNFC